MLALNGCRRPMRDAASALDAGDASTYLAPPVATRAVRTPGGGVALSGAAPANAEVRLRSPDGQAFAATASDDGAWSLSLPAAAEPRMFAFEADDQGRILHAEGALLALPSPGPAIVLTRTGFGAEVVGETGGGLRIAALDYDGAGGGAVSGTAPPRTPVRLLLDGRVVASGVSDGAGRFTLLGFDARTGFVPGEHDLRVEMRSSAGAGAVQGRWPVTPPADLGPRAFRARREGDAYRVDWRLPGGGVQTTVVLDAPTRELRS